MREPTVIQVYDGDGRRVAITSKALEIIEDKELMRGWTLVFKIANTNAARQYIGPGAVFELAGQKFDIDSYHSNTGSTNLTQVQANHVSYRLNSYVLPAGYSHFGTAAQIAQNLLDIAVSTDGSGEKASDVFSLGTVMPTDPIAFDLGNESEVTVRSAFLGLQAVDVEVDFDNFIINLPARIGDPGPKIIKFGKNLISLDRKWSVDDGTTYEIAFAPLWRVPGQPYGSEELCLGDDVQVIDPVLKDTINRRIIKYTKCHDDPTKDSLTLGVFIRDSATNAIRMRVEIQKDLATKLTEGKSYNHVAINREEGFVSTSSDRQKKVTMSGTDAFAVYVKDGDVYVKKSWLDEKGLVAGAMAGPDSDVYVQIGFIAQSAEDWHGLQLRQADGKVKFSVMTFEDEAGNQSRLFFTVGPQNKMFLFADSTETQGYFVQLGDGGGGNVECRTAQQATLVLGQSANDPIQFYKGSARYGYSGTLQPTQKPIFENGICIGYTY